MNKQEKIEELRAELKRLEEPSKWDRVSEGESYYYISSGLGVEMAREMGDRLDNDRFELGNYCRDKEYLKDISQEFSEYLRLLRWRDENDPVELDWNNSYQDKCSVHYDHMHDKWLIGTAAYTCRTLTAYFSSEELCKQAYKEVLGVKVHE